MCSICLQCATAKELKNQYEILKCAKFRVDIGYVPEISELNISKNILRTEVDNVNKNSFLKWDIGARSTNGYFWAHAAVD